MIKEFLNRRIKIIIRKLLKEIEKDNLLLLKKDSNINIDDSTVFGDQVEFDVKNGIKSFIIRQGFCCRNFCFFLVYSDASLIINQNVFFNNGCSINCLEKIEVGENSIFGEGVKIYDHNHKYHYNTDGILKIERNEFTTAPIKIGRNCWIGSNVTILKGVDIGDNVIIGAGCLVYKSVPANSIVKSNLSNSITQK